MMRNNNDSHEFKPLLAEIEEAPQNPLGRMIFWTIIGALVFFGLWMFLGRIDVVVAARGKVIPVGEIKVLQPLTAGVVRAILVREGDFVKKGQALMEIDPSTIAPELASMRANLQQLDVELLRLQAVLEEKPFAPDPTTCDAAMIRVQADIYRSTRERLVKQLRMKDEELRQGAAQQAAMRNELEEKTYRLGISQERLARLAKVKEIISRDEYDKAAGEVKTLESDIATAGHRLEELAATRQRTSSEIGFIREDEKNKQLAELAEKQKNHASLRAELEKSTYLNARQQITAPVDGHVSKLFVHTVSGVVTPAEKLIAIVPAASPLVIKALVLNQDIGFISEGMAATIKIDTFSFQKYGTIDGTVRHVSKDSIEDETLGLVYEVYVEPRQTSLLVEGVDTPITTGMSLTSEIKVGKRRIIEFFIYPLIKYLDEGMSVR